MKATTLEIAFLAAALLSLFGIAAPQRPCYQGQFDCGNGYCLPESIKCNGRHECPDGRDESNCTNVCGHDQFTCQNQKCIPISAKCDRQYDCDDLSDERNCPCLPTDFRCNNGFCIPDSQRCNGIHNCQDGSDEVGCKSICEPYQFRCNDGTCIDRMFRCNLLPNCQDRSDEIGCNTCEIDQFRCNDGTCLSLNKRCDGVPDCIHSEDEESCALCRPDQFMCENGECIERALHCNHVADCTDKSDEVYCMGCQEDEYKCAEGYCIEGYKRCNDIRDCESGSDEENCPPKPTQRECNPDEVRCGDGNCIRGSRCDGVFDCNDSSDETNCTGRCLFYEFQCSNGNCIDEKLRCDGLPDCLDGSDEVNCVTTCPGNQFKCENGICLDGSKHCDGFPDCPDSSDEIGCPPTQGNRTCTADEFRCGNNEFISMDYYCDGVPDCSDSTDESNCRVNCSSSEFTCVSDGSCIPKYYTCDGTSQCSDNSDELNCVNIPSRPRCSSNELRCNDGSCIEKYRQCDGYQDCPDGSDETGCPACIEPEWFQCSDGACIMASLRCDNFYDCKDFSDEQNCFACRNDQFECLQDRQCIDSNLRCDNHNDCRDGSDEYNCPTVVTSIPTEPTPPQITCQYGSVPCRSLNQCIRREQLCDGRADCNDISDETNCPGSSDGLNLRTYPDAQEQKEHRYKTDQEVVFTCRDEGPLRSRVHWERQNGLPLPPGTTDVRGRLEIPNIQLEHAGTYLCVASGYPPNTPGAQVSVNLRVLKREPRPTLQPTTACGLYEATCSNGDCISKNKVCDGVYDCRDGSDENRCNPNGCEPNEFQCSNKKCILKTWRCDSDDDCGDGSDESSCATNPPGSLCQYHQFACHSNNQCIPRSYHCDMERDCVDGSDEIGCSKPVISQPPPPMVNLNVGETFETTCTAVGIPTPEIVWRKNWGHIPAKCRTTSENGLGRLICENIQEEDQGAYSCEAINIKGATFAVPDTILVIKRERVCPVGYFNTEARSEAECIKCFCFGHTAECRSADLFIFQFQPPFDSLKLLGVHVDPNTGVVDIRDEPIYRGAQPNLIPVGPKGVYASVSDYSDLSQPNVVPYFAMPENYHGNQLKSYGGYLRYTVRHSDRGHPTPGPSAIITGNGYTLLHESSYSPSPNTNENLEVRFFEGDWIIKSTRERQRTATREEIMMVLEDIDNILIKLQYNEGALNTTLTNIEMDSAAAPNSGLGAAIFVEQCSCPAGYTGNSCERCSDGYVRHEVGPWLGQCYRERQCSLGQYFDGRSCQNCPCPQTSPPNLFAQTCSLGSNGDVICDCAPGYVGLRCQSCAPGYEGNPLVTGDYCRPVAPPPPAYCDADGALDPRPDANGRCRCKQLADGSLCNQCKANTFYLNRQTQFGCIPCFCMGVSSQCSSSNWYRDQISTQFTSSSGDFAIVDNLNRDIPITSGIHLNRESQEITYGGFNSSNAYYWMLPSRYLGNKITSYGGYLRYTIRHKPVPGGERSKNSGVAPDVELVSKNNINLSFANRNQTQPTSAAQTFVVPLLEQYWERSDGQPADREHLLMVLADLEAIYIKATYFTYTQESSLISVSLDIANERNTGSLERALEVEQCHCPQGYVGLSCEDCDIGYSRTQNGIYLGLCEKCNCNGYSNECDPDTGICQNCRNHTAGENCDECLPGYTGDPASGQPCIRQGSPVPCNCDPRGSISGDCTNNGCTCKVNVEGYYCDHCRNGTFGLSSNNIEGCETCFCSGVARECTESNLYIEQIPIQIDRDNHGFTLSNQDRTFQINDNFIVDVYINQISHTFSEIPRESLYWSLPDMFTGNQIKSYGGKLEFTLNYTQYPSGRYVPDRDVIISGNDLTLYYTNPYETRPNEPKLWSVLLHPSAQWFRLDQNTGLRPASREDMLIVLANIDSILIRATQSSDTTSVQLSDITLDTAVSQNTRQPKASSVEACRCPLGYRGTSCESCSSGYYKDLYFDQSRPMGSCSRCPCNNKEESCELGHDRRVICHCLPNYSGPYCETETGVDQTTPYPTDTEHPPTTIEVSIEDTSIGIYEVGSTVRFNCSAKSRILPRPITIRWSKIGGDLSEHAVDDSRGLLVITNLKVTDSGRYVCEASDGYSIVTSTVDLNVGARHDERPRVVVSQPYVDVDEGQPIEVRCAGMGFPAPELSIIRLDDQPLSPLIDGVFRISQSRLSDSAEYECIARNRMGSDSARFTIAVKALDIYARVEIEPPYYEGSSGERVVLRCRTSSSTSTTRWSKEGGTLPFDSRSDGGMLTLNNPVPEDSGIYMCSVTTYNGQTSSARSSVIITGSDAGRYPTATVSPDRVTISQGQHTELHCTANGIPPPSVKWTKLGGELSSNSEQIGSNLFIRNIRVEDRGIYVCVATNSHGIEQASVVVEVSRLEIPLLEIFPSKSQVIVAGNSAVLQCRVTAGIPTPTVTWRRGNNLPLSSNVEEMSGGTLRFTSTTRNEEGEYICTAVNDAGTANATASLMIITTPEIYITPNEDVITRNVGAFLRLECQGSGVPQPSVSWNKHGTLLVHDLSASRTSFSQIQAVQEFNHLTREDSGWYICTAENSAGTAEKRIQLVVDTLPSRGDITEGPYDGEDATSGRPDWKTYPSYDETYSAPIGTRAEIRCSISSQNQNPGIEVKWIRTDNSSLPPEAYERSGTLYIDNVQPSAAGEYRCLGIEQLTGRVLFHLNTYLKVVSPPRITLIPPRQVVHPGDNAYINCSAIGDQPISIFWAPIGRNMPSSVYTRDGYIRFNNIQLQDAGRYLCKAKNTAGEAEAVADVIVEDNYSQPPIRAEQKKQNAPVGSNIYLRCRAGNPNVRNSIRWFRENLPLPPNAQVNGEALYIQQVQQQDQGRYYCEIAGKEGTFSDYIDLTISGPVRPSYPSPTLYITPPENEHRAGENFDIVCQSNERGAITAWSKLSGWLSDNVQSSGGTLRIFNLRSDNSGIYRCEATGQQGVYHKDYNLTVLDDEYRDQPPVRIKRAPRGKSVRLECNTNLEEPITYLWSKQGGSLPNNADIYSKAVELNELNSNDAGTYTCSASSGVTNLNVPIILVVTGIIPYFTQAPNSYITLPTLGDSYMQFSFEISFKPENGNGLILYNGNRGDRSGDFISLALVNSVLEFKFNLGYSVTTVKATRPVSNGKWHTVKVVRNKKKVTMYVDADGPFVETADGKYIGLDLTEPLYLGGVPDTAILAPAVFTNSPYVGFVGCISRFKIGHVHWDVLGEALNRTGVTNCETCVDSKCENQGACQEALSKEGYSCICPSGFSGPTCNKLKGEACSPYACGVGRCIDNENGFECLCPLGRSGRRCEKEITINEPAFQNDAYIAYPTPKPARALKLTLKIKPNDIEDGILFYCGETEEGHGDFLSLAIRDKHLEFRFDAGNGVTIIAQNEELIPGAWHVLTATKSLSNGRLTVDGKASTGRVAGNHKTLNLHTPLYVGGYDKHNIKLNDGVQVYSGFNGCISDISVSGIELDIIQNATDSSNIQDCSDESDIDNNIIEYRSENNLRPVPYDNRQTGCSSNPCQNNGQCYPLTPTDYQCSCSRGYIGKSCEIPVEICGQHPCQNRGICKGNHTHYSCDCLLGYTGYNCDQRIELHNDAHFEGDGFLEFTRTLLSHSNDHEPELIALELSTNSSNGLIFWHGQGPNEDGQGQDYIALAMENGYLEFSFDLGMGPAIITNRNKRLDDGEQHTVILKREGRRGSMEIDNGVHYDEGEAEGVETTMNCYGNIYVGGMPSITRMTGGRFTQGFKGCIHGFEVQTSHRLDLGLQAINGLNVKPCSSSWDAFNSISREPIH